MQMPGAFLLLTADYRIGVDGACKIGLIEDAIGMPMHYGGVELAYGRLVLVFLTFQSFLLKWSLHKKQSQLDV